MSDPTRLLSAHSDAENLERALLESLHQLPSPRASEREAMWGGLAAQLGTLGVVAASAATAGTAGTASAAASSTIGASAALSSAGASAPAALAGVTLAGSGAAAGLGALVPKTLLAKLLIVAALGGAGGTAVWLQRAPGTRHAPAAAARGVAGSPQTALRVVLPERAPEAAPSPPVIDAVAPAARTAKPAPQRIQPHDTLVRESGMLASARAALRAGDLAQTRRLLVRLAAQFPRGELQQEREVLQIELLHARGEAQAAAEHAQRFMQAHPESPHSARLARYLR